MSFHFANVGDYIKWRTYREGECLIWHGCKRGRYGYFQWNGDIGGAHRKVYEYTKGKIPKGKILRHTCDDTRCVNVDHLLIGTKKENRADFMARHPRAMELCLAAAKTGAKGVKKFWQRLGKKERAKFIVERAAKQHAKYLERKATLHGEYK